MENSSVKRYSVCEAIEATVGRFIKYSDYAVLLKEKEAGNRE